jgi:hypothetical protein
MNIVIELLLYLVRYNWSYRTFLDQVRYYSGWTVMLTL